MNSGCFKKGLIPWNKGKKMKPETYEKVKITMFKKGNYPATGKHFGKPYLIIREHKGFINKTWFIQVDKKRKPYLKYLCEINNIDLNDKMPRLKENYNFNDIPTINDIILVTREENMKLNSMQRFPEELRKAIQIKGVLNRQINKLK